MSHAVNPPIEIDGPEHPLAFAGIPIDRQPPYPCHLCALCKGHGAWNTKLWEGGRCIIQPCPDCDGSGWVADDGHRHIADITMVNGCAAWVTSVVPRPVRILDSIPMPAHITDKDAA